VNSLVSGSAKIWLAAAARYRCDRGWHRGLDQTRPLSSAADDIGQLFTPVARTATPAASATRSAPPTDRPRRIKQPALRSGRDSSYPGHHCPP